MHAITQSMHPHSFRWCSASTGVCVQGRAYALWASCPNGCLALGRGTVFLQPPEQRHVRRRLDGRALKQHHSHVKVRRAHVRRQDLRRMAARVVCVSEATCAHGSAYRWCMFTKDLHDRRSLNSLVVRHQLNTAFPANLALCAAITRTKVVEEGATGQNAASTSARTRYVRDAWGLGLVWSVGSEIKANFLPPSDLQRANE